MDDSLFEGLSLVVAAGDGPFLGVFDRHGGGLGLYQMALVAWLLRDQGLLGHFLSLLLFEEPRGWLKLLDCGSNIFLSDTSRCSWEVNEGSRYCDSRGGFVSRLNY